MKRTKKVTREDVIANRKSILAKELANRIICDIRADFADGTVPEEEIRSFSDLHDHVDANTYGGICEWATGRYDIETIDMAQNIVDQKMFINPPKLATFIYHVKFFKDGEVFEVVELGRLNEVKIFPPEGTESYMLFENGLPVSEMEFPS